MTMLRSLFVKLAMLAAAIGVVWWIGWQAPQVSSGPAVPADSSTVVAAQRSEAGESDPSRSRGTAAKPALSEASSQPKVRSAASRLLDVNRAGAKEFESLPGIGPVLARRVIEYRTTVGGFHAIDDLRAVKGIGPKIFERIKPLVTVAVNAEGKAEKGL